MGHFLRSDVILEIPELVFQFFKLCKLTPIEIRKGIYQVHIDDQLAKELDGWRAKGGLLQFTFDKKLAETYGAELISQGSYRLDSIVRLIRKQAILSCGYLPHDVFYEPEIQNKIMEKLRIQHPFTRWYILDHQLRYGPYLWFTVRFTYLTYEKREEIRKFLVDLVSGRVLNYEIPADLLKPGTCDSNLCYQRRLSYKQAYQRLQQLVIEELKYTDASWAIQANAKLEQERVQLEQFFRDSPNPEQLQRRLEELMNRAKPRVQIRPLRAALLYIPKLEYRVMRVDTEEKINRITYDPVSSQYEIS